MPSFIGNTVEKRAPGMLGEAASLEWLKQAEAIGGLRVARVLAVTENHLVEELIRTGSPTLQAAEKIGQGIAHTHAAGAPWWGAPPPNWEGEAFILGKTRTPVVRDASTCSTWGEFFAEYRIRTYLRAVVDDGEIDTSQANIIERVSLRLETGEFDSPQPSLVTEKGHQVARLHGDLWAGNVLWTKAEDKSNKSGGVLIDPMAHGGHAETDLAMLQVFGFPHLDRVLAAYNEVSTLADGWRERTAIHQLTSLLLHCALLGAYYVPQTLEVAQKFI